MPVIQRYARPRKRKSKKLLRLAILAAVVVLVALAAPSVWSTLFSQDKKSEGQLQQTVEANDEDVGKESSKPPLVDLQPTVDAWVAKQGAEYGIVVYDPANRQVIASHNPDEKFFAASLYKLFVAYLALTDFQSGAQDPGEVLWSGFTRKECVDKMIRESHSPCGEAMMADMGQQSLRTRVDQMGIHNTIFAGITTTAGDSALILQYIAEMRDLNADNTAFLKNAMRIQDQKFRRGLAKGAPDAVWETKVGWNETYNYHDVGIMTLPNGRQYVVAILSQGNGSPVPIADFASTIYQTLNQ